MKRKDISKVLTANRLVDGEAVWFGENGRWIETLDGSQVADSLDQVEALEAIAARDVAANLVVDVALIDVRRAEGALWPVRLRERIRAIGPTFRTDLGKQSKIQESTPAQ
ncbi:MAG TPA: DUF2849 domain-containing protein [Afifellaceae bacterium]|nr:DUF2849 domain-containing protein [Afifellaceae bacterium]